VLIHAWNENAKGGWLVPTLSEGNARLEAIRSVLRPEPVELRLGRALTFPQSATPGGCLVCARSTGSPGSPKSSAPWGSGLESVAEQGPTTDRWTRRAER